MKDICLTFDKYITSLAYNPYGREVYKEQVKDKIDFNDITRIILPEQIEDVASSFIQGFAKEIIDSIGIHGYMEKIYICARNEEIEKKFKDEIY